MLWIMYLAWVALLDLIPQCAPPDSLVASEQYTPSVLPESFIDIEQHTPSILPEPSKTVEQFNPSVLPQPMSEPTITIERRNVIRNIAALTQPSTVTVAVTVTVGVVATPVAHVSVDAPCDYPTATPGVTRNSTDDNTPDKHLLNTALPYHGAIVASGYWFEEAGFDVEFRVTPLRLLIATFIYGCMQLAFMIQFGDYNLFNKAVMSLFRGLYSGSQMLWTLLLAGAMYLTYDQIQEDPASLVISELVSLLYENPGVVVIRLLVFLSKLLGYDPVAHREQPGWQHFHQNYLRQQNGTFTPKTVEELFVGGLVALFRLACWVFRLCLPVLLTIWNKIISVRFSMSLPRFVFITATVWLWNLFCDGFFFFRLFLWTKIQNPCPCQGRVPWNVDSALAGNYKQVFAFRDMARMSIWDMADVIIERHSLMEELTYLETKIRDRLGRDVGHILKELGQRAISWRTSHEEMCKDYNHCRATLDYVMSILLCNVIKVNPKDSSARRFFRSAYLITTAEPSSNGLHYKPADLWAPVHLSSKDVNKCSSDLYEALLKAKKGIKNNTAWLPLSMDLYDYKTWGFDLKRIGFEFAGHRPESNPIDLSKRQAHPSKLQEMEDYAAEGRVLEWFEDLPARLERKKRLEHPFFHSRTGM